MRLPQLGAQVPVFISPRNRVAQLYPRALGSLFVASYDSQGLRRRYSNPPPHGAHGLLSVCVYPLIVARQWLGRSVSEAKNTHATRIVGLVDLGDPTQ
jgi:hypothetical protein